MYKTHIKRRQVALATLFWLSWLILVACGGNTSTGSVVADAAAVETGQSLRAGDWEASLIRPPEKVKVIGAGDITYQATGEFLVIFAQVTNHSSDMALVGRSLFIVSDDAGQEYTPVRSAVQVAYVLQQGMEISLDSPLGAGQSRDSVIIFDIPAGATGLSFGLSGADATLTLGF